MVYNQPIPRLFSNTNFVVIGILLSPKITKIQIIIEIHRKKFLCTLFLINNRAQKGKILKEFLVTLALLKTGLIAIF